MKQIENLKIKKVLLNRIYQMVIDYKDIIKINDFYSLDEINLQWGNLSYFLIDFKKYAPDNILISSIQKKGTFAKTLE